MRCCQYTKYLWMFFREHLIQQFSINEEGHAAFFCRLCTPEHNKRCRIWYAASICMQSKMRIGKRLVALDELDVLTLHNMSQTSPVCISMFHNRSKQSTKVQKVFFRSNSIKRDHAILR